MLKIKMTKKAWAYVALLAVLFIWGVAPLISNSKWVEGKYSPAMLMSCRGFLSAVALGLMNIKKLKNINKEYLKVALSSGIFLTAGYITQMVSYLYTTPAKTAFLENVSVIIIPILLYICVKEKPTWLKVAACVLCFIGSGIIALKGGAEDFWSIGIGEWIGIISGAFFGVNIAVTGVYSKKLDASLYVFIQLSLLTVISLAYSLIVEGGIQGTMAISFEWESVLCILALGLLSTALCWTLRTSCFKYVSVVVVAVVMPFAALLTSIFSIMVGMDELTWNLVVGGVVILAAVLLAELGDIAQEKKKEKLAASPLDENCLEN